MPGFARPASTWRRVAPPDGAPGNDGDHLFPSTVFARVQPSCPAAYRVDHDGKRLPGAGRRLAGAGAPLRLVHGVPVVGMGRRLVARVRARPRTAGGSRPPGGPAAGGGAMDGAKSLRNSIDRVPRSGPDGLPRL